MVIVRVFVFYFSHLSSSSSLIFLSSLSRSFFVDLMGLDDCKWVWERQRRVRRWWVQQWLGLVKTVGGGHGLQIRVEVRIGVVGVVGFVAVLWWVFTTVCAVGFFFFLGGWGLRLWLVVVAVAMTMAMVRGDELEKLRPWRF